MSIETMPTEELEQALLAAKWGTAEADATDVVARLLELPRAAVVRVWYAFHAASNMRMGSVAPDEGEIDEEVRNAMKAQIRRGLLRTCVRESIRDADTMQIHPRALIKKAQDVCRGCPFSIACVTHSYSTPDKCFKSGPPIQIDERSNRPMHLPHGGARVYPERIRGDLVTVRCDHPHGTYDVDVGELWP